MGSSKENRRSESKVVAEATYPTESESREVFQATYPSSAKEGIPAVTISQDVKAY